MVQLFLLTPRRYAIAYYTTLIPESSISIKSRRFAGGGLSCGYDFMDTAALFILPP